MGLGRALLRRGAGNHRSPSPDGFSYRGGLNQADSEHEIGPGELLDVLNYEPIYTSGYARVKGYEVFDGQPSPSEAGYLYMPLLGEEPTGQYMEMQRYESPWTAWTEVGTIVTVTGTSGYNGDSNGFELEDTNGSVSSYIYQDQAITADNSLYRAQCFVEKEAIAPSHFPVLEFGDATGVGDEVAIIIRAQKDNGDTTDVTGKNPGGLRHGIIDWSDDLWLVWIYWANAGTSTTMRLSFYPAAASSFGGSLDVTATGATKVDLLMADKPGKIFSPEQNNPHQILKNPRLLTGSDDEDTSSGLWEPIYGGSNILLNQTGYDGEINSGWTVNGGVRQYIEMVADAIGGIMYFSFLIGKVSSTPSEYPVFRYFEATSSNDYRIIYDHENGASVPGTGYLPLDHGIESYNDDYWLAWAAIERSGSYSNADVYLYSSGATVLTGATVLSNSGSVILDLIEGWFYPNRPHVPPKTSNYPAAGSYLFGASTEQMLDDTIPGTQSVGTQDFQSWTSSASAPTINLNSTDGWFGQAAVTNRLHDDSSSEEYKQQAVDVRGAWANDRYLVSCFLHVASTPPDSDIRDHETGKVSYLTGIKISTDGGEAVVLLVDPIQGTVHLTSTTSEKPPEYGIERVKNANDSAHEKQFLVWVQIDNSTGSEITVTMHSAYTDLYEGSVGVKNNSAFNYPIGGSSVVYAPIFSLINMYPGYSSPHAGEMQSIDTSGATDYIILHKLLGTFYDQEMLLGDDGYPFASLSGDPLTSHPTRTTHLANLALAQAARRSDIEHVPGGGIIRGIVQYKSVAYGFRDDVAGSTGRMYKSTATSWKQIKLSKKLRFITGVTKIVEGDEITGVTSSAKAHVKRVIKTSGTWGTDAAGYLIIDYFIDGGPFNASEAIQVSAATVATTNGAEESQAFTLAGRYEFKIWNFGGHSGTKRIYGANGVNNGFDLDSTDDTVCFIETGMTTDEPTHVSLLKAQLVFSFEGGSVQLSGVKSPLIWTIVTGAGEIGIGEEVSDFVDDIGEALIILGRNQTFVYYNKQGILDRVNDESGCVPYTAQRMFQGVYLDDRGVTTTPAVQEYGNFASSSISRKVGILLTSLLGTAVSSHVSRRRNLYRVSFSDGTNVVFGFNGKNLVGITQTDYGIPLRVVHSYEDDDNEERIFAGSDNGFIYELDKGNSFDGAVIEAHLYPAFYNFKSPGLSKHIRGAIIDFIAEGDATVTVSAEYDNGDAGNVQPTQDIAISSASSSRRQMRVRLDGDGLNMRLKFDYSQSDEPPHEIHGVTLPHSKRRIDRSTVLS